MPTTCFVADCSSGYWSSRKKNKLAGTKNPSIFKAPSDPKTFDLWVKSVPRKHRPFGVNDGICEYHFTADCIRRNHPARKAGREGRVKARPSLIKGSVPTIFTDDAPSTEYDLKRKIPKSCSAEESVAGSSLCDSSAASSSATDENITDPYSDVDDSDIDDTDPQPQDSDANKPTPTDDAIIELSSDDGIPDSSHRETEVVKLSHDSVFQDINENIKLFPATPSHDPNFERVDENIKPSDDHVPLPSSHIDIAELSPPDSLLSDDGIAKPLPSEMGEPSIRSGKDDQFAEILDTSSAVWSLNDLYNYVSSLQSLKDDNFICCRFQATVILQQLNPSSYQCMKKIVFEENLRPRVFLENERFFNEELLRLDQISSESKLQSLITLVKELKVRPKISDFHLESFYKKVVRQN